VARQPRAVLVALAVQSLLLPPVAFGLAWLQGLPPELAVGLVLLSASPGGVTANIFSHLARGDVALNVTLTAVNSALALITLPLWTGLALQWFMDSGSAVPPPLRKLLEVAVIVVVPVVLGMVLRAWRPKLADAAEKPVRAMSTMLLVVLIALAIVSEFEVLRNNAAVVGLACLGFNLISLFSGYFAGLVSRLGRPQAIAIGFEISIHNSTLAIILALQVLGNERIAIPAAVYAALMYPVAAGFVYWLNRRARRETVGAVQ
ncbi:MAG: bile acid:sodium symporter family protein, partial [Gammaproteobacteria bacterium]|nr:bile acid:sodium symporter family protein [Gammaproteobacteria bacterium]